MHKIMSRQLTTFLIITLTLLTIGSVAIQAQDSTKVVAPAQPQPLSPEEFQKVIHSTITQDWMAIHAMTDDQVKAIMNSKVIVARLGAVVEDWQALLLNGLTYITDEQAKLLAKNEVNLSFDGLTSLSDEQAKSFSTYKGKYMPQAYKNDDKYQQTFGMRAGGVLSLNGIATLSDEQAKWLAKAKCFELDLNSLISISDLQAKSFGYFTGAILQINAVKTLTDKQAKALAQFQGKIACVGLDKASKDLFLKYGGSLFGKE
jgi:hypothetical protein